MGSPPAVFGHSPGEQHLAPPYAEDSIKTLFTEDMAGVLWG